MSLFQTSYKILVRGLFAMNVYVPLASQTLARVCSKVVDLILSLKASLFGTLSPNAKTKTIRADSNTERIALGKQATKICQSKDTNSLVTYFVNKMIVQTCQTRLPAMISALHV
jgi:hypothetical protein